MWLPAVFFRVFRSDPSELRPVDDTVYSTASVFEAFSASGDNMG